MYVTMSFVTNLSNLFQLPGLKTCIKRQKHILRNLKGKDVSSQNWLIRQMKDPYVEKAKLMNYRCRSAFKLLEIDEKLHIFKPGQVVVDCGAAPGSWTQVALEKTDKSKSGGTVIAVDRLQIYPIKDAIVLGNSDFTSRDVQSKIMELLDGKLVDVVLSDMAPNASGIKVIDQENIISLCYSVFRFALNVSFVGGTLVMKLWQGKGAGELHRDLERFYRTVKIVKPASSRANSAELFYVAKEFKGLKK